jgi:transcriptional regulator
MYLPPQFRSLDLNHVVELIQSHPLATLISTDDAGFPFLTHLPLHVERAVPGEPGDLVLFGHLARPNPQRHHLAARPEALVSFLGPHAYLSPKVYPDLARVPTWNYLAVQCRVRTQLIDLPDLKDPLLKTLIGDHEPEYASQWRGLGEDYQQRMLAGIVGLRLDVVAWECKLKVNQHRPEAFERTVQIYGVGNDNERALAAWMRRLADQALAASSKDEPKPS